MISTQLMLSNSVIYLLLEVVVCQSAPPSFPPHHVLASSRSRPRLTSNRSQMPLRIRCGDAAAEMPPHFEFSEREPVGYFQLKASVSLSVSQSVIDHRDYYVSFIDAHPYST